MHEETHCRPSKKACLFERLRPVDEDWWDNQMTDDEGGPTPPDSPEGAVYPLPNELREDLEDYATKWGDIDMEFANGQVFPLQFYPNESNVSHFAPFGLQNLENISNSCCPVKLDNIIWNQNYNLCEHQQTFAACPRCKGKASNRARWMLDSGASRYYTLKIGDFDWHDYLPKDKHVPVAMANNITYVEAIGQVTIRHVNSSGQQCSTIVENVNYIPSLTARLLSLGQFLKDGYIVNGDDKSIVLTKNKIEAMRFLPRWPGDSIYELQTTTSA